MSCLQKILYYQENKLLSQLLHEKRVPKGTHCTEGFVTVRRTVKTWSSIVVWFYYSIKKISYYLKYLRIVSMSYN